jgi:hypothetical protein
MPVEIAGKSRGKIPGKNRREKFQGKIAGENREGKSDAFCWQVNPVPRLPKLRIKNIYRVGTFVV